MGTARLAVFVCLNVYVLMVAYCFFPPHRCECVAQRLVHYANVLGGGNVCVCVCVLIRASNG